MRRMLSIRNMQKDDLRPLYDIALRSFQPDYEKYGVYPPFINEKDARFLPPRVLGKTILVDEERIGGAFISGFGKKGEIGTIFLDTAFQNKGYGKQVMLLIEARYPKVRRWRLDALADHVWLHSFYESLGYVKTGETTDKKSGLRIFAYEKTIKSGL